MTNIQIKEIILWSKKDNVEPEVIKFKTGKLNVIHGASKRGKSAIIHIIDWCLASSKNTIPQGEIRENVSWFGLKLKFDNKEILLIRENLDTTNELYYLIDNEIIIPKNPKTNYLIKDFKEEFNNILGVPFFEIIEQRQSRPSFRDFVSFNFQTQGIVADQYNLLYKTNLSEYRQRIRDIFNFAIGAESSAILGNKLLKKQLKDKLDDLIKKNDYNSRLKQQLVNDNVDILFKALEVGLLCEDDIESQNQSKLLSAYKLLSKKTIYDLNIDKLSQETMLKEIKSLDTQLMPLYEQLRKLKISKKNLLEVINLGQEQQNMLLKKRERLEISGFIKDFCGDNLLDSETQNVLNNICEKLEDIELELSLKSVHGENSLHQKRKNIIDNETDSTIGQINSIVKMKNSLMSNNNEKSLIENIYVNLILKAKNIIQEYEDKDIPLEESISNLKNHILNLNTHNKLDEYLSNIVAEAQKYVPSFAEFKYIDSFDTNNLTIKIRESELSKAFYLSETGSGANWVAFHIATLLGFHKHFIDKKTPVFNFLIFDQPSQVYFPKSVYDEEKKVQIFTEDEDVKAVREMFEIMNKGITDNNEQFQIIVLDHAGKDIWGDIADINEVVEWIGDKALIPMSWLEA